MDAPPEMVQALTEATPDVLALEGVNGLDIGLDESGEFTMRLLVSDPDDPPADLPDQIGGFPVILVAGEPFLEQVVTPDVLPHNPLIGGIQLGSGNIVGGVVQAGTLGCVFRDLATGEPVAISNSHVLCGAVGDVVQQPAPATDPPPTAEKLGNLLRCETPNTPTFLPTPGNAPFSGFFDAAVCSIVDRPANIGEIAQIGQATGIGSPQLGDLVRKRGYRTLLTHGVVEGIFGRYVAYDPNGNPLWWMLGQVSIAMIPDLGLNPDGIWSNSGDSGSVVVNQANEIVAQHWGGDNNGRGYATDFSTLAIALGISL
jgi:hypothetical protein